MSEVIYIFEANFKENNGAKCKGLKERILGQVQLLFSNPNLEDSVILALADNMFTPFIANLYTYMSSQNDLKIFCGNKLVIYPFTKEFTGIKVEVLNEQMKGTVDLEFNDGKQENFSILT